ncbi:NDP-hexose 2,3-dehydratase family protein [Actinokineospora soli]
MTAVFADISARLARSAATAPDLAGFHEWFGGLGAEMWMTVDRVPLDDLDGWRTDPVTGDIGHRSGRFFSVEGLDVAVPGAPIERWSQPIIHQPEVGILGILAKEFDGVLHFLMQAKVEPGNCNGLQLSPTVQATRSNYTGVHGGKPIPYLEHFREHSGNRVVTDVRQSEQGSWFYRKRNRNMVVETDADVPLEPGFRWLTLGQVNALLQVDHLVNMDARTVLSCLPFAGPGLGAGTPGDDGFRRGLVRSCDSAERGRHTTREILSWITEVRSGTEVRARRVPLADVRGWRRAGGGISHDDGLFFDVVGVDVRARGREVGNWMQPMFSVAEPGLAAFVVRRIGGVLHALVHARVEPGFVDLVELAPTVQCTPHNHDRLPAASRPRFLDAVLGADPARTRFDTELSEEGGRFYHARTRHLVVEDDGSCEEGPGYRWMTLRQMVDLLQHSHYVNIQARSLVACLHSLVTA